MTSQNAGNILFVDAANTDGNDVAHIMQTQDEQNEYGKCLDLAVSLKT